MTINKYTGKTEEEAMEKVRKELGSAAVIMNVKVVKPKGIGGLFKGSTYEVTAAVEDDGFSSDAKAFATSTQSPASNLASHEKTTSSFEAVADDDALLLKNAFSAVNEVLEKQGEATDQLESPLATKSLSTMEAPITNPREESFEPLSDSVPHAKVFEATYSRPVGARSVQMTQPSRAAAANPSASTIAPAPYAAPAPKKGPKSNPTSSTSTSSVMDETIHVKGGNSKPSIDGDNHVFVKMLYNVLLENEVQEKYINQVLEDMDRVLQTSHSLDNLLSNVYQKMVLKLGTPTKITSGERRPKVVFFIGPTGVGKTTTIAKIASKFKVEEGKKVGLITADTYRMAAANQLQTYANILGVPLNVIYSAEELLDTVKKQSRENEDLDVILVDTIGFSHKNEEQKHDTEKLINALNDFYDSEVYLVLSATTKQKDLMDIAKSYMEFASFNLIFTKLDETQCLGNIYNMKQYTGAPLSYVTVGQSVPDDIEILNTQKLVKQLLGGN
ncbi:MAG: flagellar biosynthesis protein FlhF [Pseudobutyrivibrio sp.]|nr:flagellar biosynthesis protein FlhF [Pseudobutyrivibrio sp.]